MLSSLFHRSPIIIIKDISLSFSLVKGTSALLAPLVSRGNMHVVFDGGEVGHSSMKGIGRDEGMHKPDHSPNVLNFYIWYKSA